MGTLHGCALRRMLPPGVLVKQGWHVDGMGMYDVSFIPEDLKTQKCSLRFCRDDPCRGRWRDALRDGDILAEIINFQKNDSPDISELEEDEEICQLMDQWMEAQEITSKMNDEFDRIEMEVERHVLRARAGPPKGKYLVRHRPYLDSFEGGVEWDPREIVWPSSKEELYEERFIPEYIWDALERVGWCRSQHPWFSWNFRDLKSQQDFEPGRPKPFLPKWSGPVQSNFLELPWRKKARGRWSTLRFPRYPCDAALVDDMNEKGEFITEAYYHPVGMPDSGKNGYAETKYGICAIPNELVKDVLEERIALGRSIFLLCTFADTSINDNYCGGVPLAAHQVLKKDPAGYGEPFFPDHVEYE